MFFGQLSRTSSNLGYVGLITRSQGPKEILVYTVCHICDQGCYKMLWYNIIFHNAITTYTLGNILKLCGTVLTNAMFFK